MIVLILVVVCVNVAVLIYARTTTRRGEIAVRTALGASRRRVVLQLFIEALVLAGVAALAGLGIAKFGLVSVERIFQAGIRDVLPFWFDIGIPRSAVAFTALLTVLAAVIMGVAPGLQATGG